MTAASDSDGAPLAPVIPLFSVVRGTPTPVELAVLVAVIASRGGGGDEPEQAPPSLWASPAARLRQPLHPGPGAWAASAWR